MDKTSKIILGVVLFVVAGIGALAALGVSTFKSFFTTTQIISEGGVETGNQKQYTSESWREVIPNECQTFSDGCNTCNRMENGEVACTKMYCEEYDEPRCLDGKGSVEGNISGQEEIDINQTGAVKNKENVSPCDPSNPDSNLSQCALPEENFAFVSRENALELVKDKGLQSLEQSHDLTVMFVTENGKKYMTQEPEVDKFLELKEICGEKCKDTVILTE